MKSSDFEMIVEDTGPLWVYEKPDPDDTYVIGIDAQEGKVRDRSHGHLAEVRASRNPDFNAMSVIRMSDGLEVASYLSNYAPGLVVEDATMLGHQYGKASGCEENAFLVPEINGPGIAIIEGLRERGYPRVWLTKKWNRLEQGWEKSLGWRTTIETRPIMVKALQDVIRDGSCGIRCFRTISHVSSMRYNNQGKPEAPSGAHDDLAFAHMLAIQGRRALYEEPQDESSPPGRDPDRDESAWVWEKFDKMGDDEVKPWEEMAW